MTVSKWLLAPAALLALSLGAPAVVHAQDNNYDGYCYAQKHEAKKSGAVTGAVIGALVGSQVSKHERGLGAVGGAVVGGSIGANAGKDSVKCYNGDYYSYQGTYYSPPPPPDGYETVYYKSRPDGGYYSRVNTAPPHGY